MRSHRLYIFKNKTKPAINQAGFYHYQLGKTTNQASAHFGVVDVQSALLWGEN